MGTERQLANGGVVQPRDFYLPRLAMDVQDTFGLGAPVADGKFTDGG